MDGATPTVKHPGSGEHLQFAGGGVLTLKASAADTAGAVLIFEHRASRGKATPLHVHHNEDEGIYVLEGGLRVHIAGAEHVLETHGFFFVPRGVPHAFIVTSEQAHLLCVQTPATIEAFYRSASDPVDAKADETQQADPGRVREAARRFEGITMIGPPPFSF
jgi:quercetin dioxygenase-like cupin family protein